ncbi:MAG: DUF2000 family protein [Proteobacteria bacterium]|nr:DUF2000 family protein [Pseudomonadota bacterium]
MSETKIAIIIRNDLETWQKLNVTAFLTGGVLSTSDGLLGENYEDADGVTYTPLIIQPIIILGTDAAGLKKIHARALSRECPLSVYIEDMFKTGNDTANRAAVKQYGTDDLNFVGLALRAEKKIVDKITKGAKMHP